MNRNRSTASPAHGCRVACPACGASVVPRPIVWGYPTRETMTAAERGDVVLGGCLVSETDPTHLCPACQARLFEFAPAEFVQMVPAVSSFWPYATADIRPH